MCINSFNPLRTLWSRNFFYYIIRVPNSSWPSKIRSFKSKINFIWSFSILPVFLHQKVCLIGKYPLFSMNSIFDQLKCKLRVTIRKFPLSVKYSKSVVTFGIESLLQLLVCGDHSTVSHCCSEVNLSECTDVITKAQFVM